MNDDNNPAADIDDRIAALKRDIDVQCGQIE
jgi:hypothetical protein